MDAAVAILRDGRDRPHARIDKAAKDFLTEVDLAPDGDTRYPDFDEADWIETRREEHCDDDPAWTIRWLRRR